MYHNIRFFHADCSITNHLKVINNGMRAASV